MFYNTDAPGRAVQDDGRLLMKIAREPDVALYRDQWDVVLPESRKQALDAPGRPKAHLDFQLARGAAVGNFPNEDDRWRRLRNYYFNCIRQTDALVLDLLSELEDLGLTENTIIVMTADHGELGGAHGTHGKGATAYQEQNHVPLIVAHPGYTQSAGKSCAAVTSHLDIAPTLTAWGGAAPKDLLGRDITSLLSQPEKAGPRGPAAQLTLLLQHVRLSRQRFHPGGRRPEERGEVCRADQAAGSQARPD